MKDGSPLSMACLWEEWTDRESGEMHKTLSIVTTRANEAMAFIHNNPKLEGPLMPVILPREKQDEWFEPWSGDTQKEHLLSLCRPFDSSALSYKTIRPIRGKSAVADDPSADKEVRYEELILPDF